MILPDLHLHLYFGKNQTKDKLDMEWIQQEISSPNPASLNLARG